MKKRSFGLIGKSLKHSFSPTYFKDKFSSEGILDAEYLLYDLDKIDEVRKLLNNNYHGFNVTIPYKEAVIPYLDDLDDEAKEIGAVNTLRNIKGKWIGYNTDVIGFEKDLLDFLDGDIIENALILGSGGASKGIQHILRKKNINFLVVSRTKGDISYKALSSQSVSKHKLIINTTPLGMFPNVDQIPDLEMSEINSNHYLYDLIYNPQKSLFLKKCEVKGAKVRSGLGMLRYQAEESWIIWNKKT